MKMSKTEKEYYRIKEELSWFIYKWANLMYYEEEYSLAFRDLVKEYKDKLGSPCSIYKATDKLRKIFATAEFAFDLPDHPEKHNGFKNEWIYEEAVMRVFGFDYSTAMFKKEMKRV